MDNTEKINLHKHKNTTLTLLDYYENDIWDLSKHEYIDILDSKRKGYIIHRNHHINFSDWKNHLIKKEVKYYIQDLIEDKKFSLVTIVSYAGVVKAIGEFLNRYTVIENTSLNDYDISEVMEGYEQFLVGNGYKISSETNNILSENMEYKTHKVATIYYRLLRDIMVFIQKQYEPKKSNTNLFELDKWDVRNLPFRVNGISPSRPRYTISFANIKQTGINRIAKKFVLQRLKTKQLSTCIDDLKGINMLSKFLSKNYSEIDSLEQLDRDIIEEYLGFINLDDNLKPRTKSTRIGVLKTFFDLCTMNQWNGAPRKTLIVSQDIKKKYRVLPKYYEDDVLLQINEHLEGLPIQIARMCYVIQNIGMRISELCNLKVDCLKNDSEGDGVLVYFQIKTRSYNRVPINENLVTTIKEAMKHSRNLYGENSEYVFMQDEKGPISSDTFSYHMNQLMKKNNILDSTANIVRIKSHHFRATVATGYANKGMKPNMIRMLLGQKSLGTLKHYVEIFDETVAGALEEVIKHQDMMIQNIGVKVESVKQDSTTELGIPLPNGTCTKPLSTGKCLTANACYTCAMFKPDSNNIDLFKKQLIEAETNLEMAKINNFERLVQVNQDLADSLNKIITDIEKSYVAN